MSITVSVSDNINSITNWMRVVMWITVDEAVSVGRSGRVNLSEWSSGCSWGCLTDPVNFTSGGVSTVFLCVRYFIYNTKPKDVL